MIEDFDRMGMHDAEFVRCPRELLPVIEIVVVVESAVAAEILRRLGTRREDFWSPTGELPFELRIFVTGGITDI